MRSTIVKVVVLIGSIWIASGCEKEIRPDAGIISDQNSSLHETYDDPLPSTITDKKDMINSSDYAYIDLTSGELVLVNKDFETKHRVYLPSEVIKDYRQRNMKTQEDPLEKMWTAIEGGICFSYYTPDLEAYNLSNYYVYNIGKEEFYDLGTIYEGYVGIWEDKLTYNDGYNHIYDMNTNHFNIVEDTNSILASSEFVFDGVYYYESLLSDDENPKFRSFDERKVYQTNIGDERICNVVSNGTVQVVLLDISGRIGIINGDAFEAISSMAIKSYDINDQGVVFTGFEDEATLHYYAFENKQTYVLETQERFNDAKFINEKIVALYNGCKLNTYNITSIENGSWKVLQSLDLKNLTDEEIPSYHLDSDGTYLVAYARDYAIDLRKIYKTFIINSNLNVVHEMNSEYDQIIDGGYVFTRAYPLVIRYTIEENSEDIINKNYWFDSNPEEDELERLKALPIEVRDDDEDVTVLINDVHGLRVTVIDHRSNETEYFRTFWHFHNVEEINERLHGKAYKSSLESSYPLPEGRVKIIFEDQM